MEDKLKIKIDWPGVISAGLFAVFLIGFAGFKIGELVFA